MISEHQEKDYTSITRERNVFKKQFLTIQNKYENKIQELSILKELGETLRSADFHNRNILFWNQIKIVMKHMALSGISLILTEENSDGYELVADSYNEGPVLHPVYLPLEDKDLKQIIRQTNSITIRDISKQPFFNGIRRLDEGTMCFVPIIHNNNSIGVLCLHTTDLQGFDNNAKHFFSIVADQIATAVILFRLYNNMLEEENRRYVLSRFFSKAITETILNQGKSLRLGGERKNVTILFADLCGFTSMSEKLEQEQVLNILNRYFSFAIPIVFEFDGTLDKLMGDGMMTFFGAPIPHPDDPARALKMAIRLISALKRSDIKIPGQPGKGNTELKVSVGINTGDVVAGYLGSEDHLNYTVIGDAVNIAQRLQTLAGSNEILISRSTYNAIKDADIDGVRGFTHLKGQKVKGRNQTVDTYRVELAF